MTTDADMTQMMGATAYTQDGDKLGKIGQVFLDDHTGQLEFVTVNTGFFGSSESFVPAGRATMSDDGVTLPFDKETIKGAPKVDIDQGHLDVAAEDALFQYYGMTYATADQLDTGPTDTTTNATTDTTTEGVTYDAGHDTSGLSTDDAMTRSEEHLEVSTGTREAGRARLRKYVTTEQESVTVPVTSERAVITTEPITDANRPAAGSGAVISEEEHEVVLHEEVASAQAVAVPVERVALGTETVTTNQTVTGEVRKENIEVDGDVQDDVEGVERT